MGIVFKARQVSRNRIVALKMILAGRFASEAFVQRFRVEAKAAASLQHPNIVAIHEVGEHEGQHYFSMDYIEGKSLAAEIEDGRWKVSGGDVGARCGDIPADKRIPPSLEVRRWSLRNRRFARGGGITGVLRLVSGARTKSGDCADSVTAVQAAAAPTMIHGQNERVQLGSAHFASMARLVATIPNAIHYAQQRGIIHRDLKPSNILIDADRQPHITDFGLAKHLEGDSEMTLTGQVLGSPNYLPPEQANGKRSGVAVQSDVYSLGAILYHLLTGRPPFVGETIQQTLAEVLNREPVAPHTIDPAVPLDLETICLKCLEKEPSCRYQSAEDLADELARFLADEPIQARPVGRFEKSWRWCRRNPMVASLSAATVLLLLSVAIGSPIAGFRINRERQRAEQNAEERRQQVVRFNVANGTRLVNEGDSLSALPWFVQALKLDQGRPEREAVHRLRIESVIQHSPKLVHAWFLPGTPDRSEFRSRASARFSPDGGRIATVTGRLKPDGAREGEARIWDSRSGEPLSPPLVHQGNVYHLEFSPDGSRLLTTSGTFANDGAALEGQARLGDGFTGRPLLPPLNHTGVVNQASFSPDGGRILVAAANQSIFVADAYTGELLRTYRKRETHRFEYSASFSSDGRRILIGARPMEIWDATTGALVRTLRFGIDGKATFDSTAQRIAVPGFDGAAWTLDANTGRPLTSALRHQSRVNSVCFSCDDRMVATGGADRNVRLWDTGTGEPVTPPLRHPLPVLSVRFSPKNDRLITACGDSKARIWKLAPYRFTNEELTLLSQILSARRIDQTGTALEPIDAAVIEKAWRSLHERHPKLFGNETTNKR